MQKQKQIHRYIKQIFTKIQDSLFSKELNIIMQHFILLWHAVHKIFLEKCVFNTSCIQYISITQNSDCCGWILQYGKIYKAAQHHRYKSVGLSLSKCDRLRPHAGVQFWMQTVRRFTQNCKTMYSLIQPLISMVGFMLQLCVPGQEIYLEFMLYSHMHLGA